jgi:hypothetical protein
MALNPGTLTTLTGPTTLTGSLGFGFSTIYALIDTDITISGSNLGVARFVMPKGMRFEATLGAGGYSVQNYIQRITLHNTYGSVLVASGAYDS